MISTHSIFVYKQRDRASLNLIVRRRKETMT